MPAPKLVDPLQSSRVALSAAKIRETLIHKITVRFIAWVIKRVSAGRLTGVVAGYKTKENAANYNRARTSTRSLNVSSKDTSSFTSYIDEQ